MDFKAKYRSNGFRGKFWEKGQIANNITDEELKLTSMQHFEPVSNVEPKKVMEAESPQYMSLLTYRSAYIKKFTRDIPKEHYNDPEWLRNEIEKPDNVLTKTTDPGLATDASPVSELEELKAKYLITFNKEVCLKYSKNIDWIKLKLEEA